jgi:hypothetical protein
MVEPYVYKFEVDTEDTTTVRGWTGYVTATIKLGGTTVYSEMYSLNGPDRFRDAADLAMRHMANRLSALLDGSE